MNAFLSMRSPNTRLTYAGIIREWCSFLGSEAGTPAGARKFLAATDLHAMAYKNTLEKKKGMQPRMKRSDSSSDSLVHTSDPRIARGGQKKSGLESTLANATIAKKFAALRRMYRMCIGAGLAHENPFDSDKVPPPPKESGKKRPTEMIEFSVVKEILSLPDASTPKGLRDRALLAALFGGGLRRSEAVSLRIGDVRKSAQGTIFLRLRATKAKKDFDQAIPKWAAASVLALVEARKKEGASLGDFLFVGYRGQAGKSPSTEPMSENGLYRIFKSYCIRAGAGNFVTPHSARATAITKLLNDGVPHREVQEFSRHASIQMVEVYDKRRIGVDQNPAKDLDYD